MFTAEKTAGMLRTKFSSMLRANFKAASFASAPLLQKKP